MGPAALSLWDPTENLTNFCLPTDEGERDGYVKMTDLPLSLFTKIQGKNLPIGWQICRFLHFSMALIYLSLQILEAKTKRNDNKEKKNLGRTRHVGPRWTDKAF